MRTINLKKGFNQDELRRLKEKSRNTQKFLSETKKVKSSAGPSGETAKSLSSTMKSSMTGSTNSHSAIIVDLLLFGQSPLLKK